MAIIEAAMKQQLSPIYIQGWAKVWNIYFYSKTIENNVTKLFKIIISIVVDASVFFHVLGETEVHLVKEVVRI